MNKKLVSLAILGFVFQTSAMMNQRVAAKRMYERNQVQSHDCKVPRSAVNLPALPVRHRAAILDFAQMDSFGKKFMALTICAALAISAAAAYTRDPNACFSDFSRPSTYKEARLRLPDAYLECPCPIMPDACHITHPSDPLYAHCPPRGTADAGFPGRIACELRKNLTGLPIFFDDGERCYLKPDKTVAPTYWAIVLRKLKRAAKLLVDYENEH